MFYDPGEVSTIGKVRALAADAKRGTLDGSWMLPLALYRLSGRRLARSSQLYRSGVLRQRYAPLPGMTSPTERAYFKWHAQENFTGRGEVIDLGSWFGSTTAALAMGLSANPRRTAMRAKVHAYDRFEWEWWMEQYAGAAKLGPYAPGDSFLQEFELVMAPWWDRVEVHVGDLMEQRWSRGGVELLLIDAMKSWELTSHIVTAFYPFVMPDWGYVLHQDFGHCYTPWIHLVTYALRDYLVPVQDVVKSDTMVFRAVGSLEDASASLQVTRVSFDDRDVESAFRHSLGITRPEKHSGIRAARLMLLVHDGDLAKATGLLRELARKRKLNEYDASAVRGAIQDAERAHAS